MTTEEGAHRGFDLRAAAGVVGDLARAEREAVLCVGPRRKWSDLEKFDEEINEAEQASAALSAELAQAFTQRQEEDARHTAELSAWLENGSRGDKPTSRADELDQRIRELQVELAAREIARVRLRERRAAHIAKHRKRFASDMANEVAEAETRYRRIVDELEQARQDLVDARATQVWVLLYPHQNLMSSPDTRAVAGGRRTAMQRHFPGVETTLLARNLFACLREDDAAFCAQVSTVEQAAAIKGVSVGRLTGREALWSDSDEGRAEARRERNRPPARRARTRSRETRRRH